MKNSNVRNANKNVLKSTVSTRLKPPNESSVVARIGDKIAHKHYGFFAASVYNAAAGKADYQIWHCAANGEH